MEYVTIKRTPKGRFSQQFEMADGTKSGWSSISKAYAKESMTIARETGRVIHDGIDEEATWPTEFVYTN